MQTALSESKHKSLCTRKVGLLPQVSILGAASKSRLGDLQELLSHFARAMGQQEMTVEDCEHIEGEEVVANPRPGCAAAADDARPAEEQQENAMEPEEPPHHISLRNAQQAARDALSF